jgi:hypothetical protein
MSANYYLLIKNKKYRVFQINQCWIPLLDYLTFFIIVFTYLDNSSKKLFGEIGKKLLKNNLYRKIDYWKLVHDYKEDMKFYDNLTKKIDDTEITPETYKSLYKECSDFINDLYECYGSDKWTTALKEDNYRYTIKNEKGLVDVFKKIYELADTFYSEDQYKSPEKVPKVNWNEFINTIYNEDSMTIRGHHLCLDENMVFSFMDHSDYD